MLRLLIAMLLGLLVCVGAPAQDVQPSGEEDIADLSRGTEPGDVQSTDQQLKLDEQANDAGIADRLNRVYETAGWFENLKVTARDGIVLIDGQTTREEYREWAGQLARRTEGVVAVVNRIEVDEPPAIDSFSLQREINELWDQFLDLLPLIGIGLLVIIICTIVARYLSRLLARPLTRLTDSHLLQNIGRKLIAVIIVLVGVILFLRITGLTGVAVTLVSGTGIIGLIIGFAFRDIAENFLASILMSVQTPFRLGDVIEVAGHTGVVHKVTARGTVLVDFDGNHIQIANSTVYKSTLKNLTANPKMRLHFVVGIGYDASISIAQNTALAILKEHSAVLDDPEPLVLVDQLGASTINLKIYFWINGHEHSALKVKSAMMRKVLRAIEKAGISLPDESREIIFPHGVPVQIETTGDQASAIKETAKTESSAGSGTKNEHQRQSVAEDMQHDATEAEGDLTSEVDEIKEQAAQSREVEEGRDIVG